MMKNYTTKMEQWVDFYRSATDGEIKTALKTFYNMKAWHELHIALWVWLAMDGEREKEEWFEKFNIPEVKQRCFACEEAEISFSCCPLTTEEEDYIKPSLEDEIYKPDFCCRCPLTNPSSEECLDGLYDDWWAADPEQKEKLAIKIATMKWEERL